MYIVKLENNVWLSDGLGDPNRTTVQSNAKTFNDFVEAKHALVIARKYRPFFNAQIQRCDGLPICQISGMTEQQSHEISNAMVKAIQNRDHSKPMVFVGA